jgi:hypothetical protein
MTESIDVRDFAIGRIVSSDTLAALGETGILNHVERDADGTLLRSVAVVLIDAPLERVAAEVKKIRSNQGGFLAKMNMIHSVKVLDDDGDRLRIRLLLRYRYLLFSAKFQFDADVVVGNDGRLDMIGVDGKPSGFKAHFRAEPVERGGRPQTIVVCSVRFDVRSMGWLVDTFLRHHPEIELGVFSASAPVILLTLKEAVEG